jgi:coenzyme F420-dependent glucose-6-phosphate dehydrogenase
MHRHFRWKFMPRIGFHASHEQFAPRELLDLVQRAEQAKFAVAMCSDHFHPWSHAQGQSGHAWSWLGAAMAMTQLPFGVVTSPVGRYHPAVLAQAAATLAQMFPGRFWLAVGSGEALNEAITGDPWPDKSQRNQSLQEAAAAMRALWRGEEVSWDGAIEMEKAQLYTLPPEPPLLLAPALTEATARWAAGWADGLITISQPREQLRALVDAFREGGGEGKPMYLQVKLSYAENEQAALEGAMQQWRTNVLSPKTSQELKTPAQYEAAAESVNEDDIRRAVRVSCDLPRQLAWLQEDAETGFDHLYLHNVNREQSRFIDDFGERVLPGLNVTL